MSARLSPDYVPQRLLLLGNAQALVEVVLPPRSWGQDAGQAAQLLFEAGQTVPAATPARLLAVFSARWGGWKRWLQARENGS